MTDVIVFGSGPAELAGALEFASVGVKVTVLDGAPEPVTVWPTGGVEDPEHEIRGWIPFATGETISANTHVPVEPCLFDASSRETCTPVASGSVFGIPPSPLSTEVSGAIGTGGSLRAYLDRLMPILTIGQTRFVADLVRKRIGSAALQTFVELIVLHRFGRPSSDVEVAELAPGLNETVSRVGSLTGGVLAYADRYEELTTLVEPEGGWAWLESKLRERLTHFGVRFVEADEIELGDRHVFRALNSAEPQQPRRLVAVATVHEPHWCGAGERVIRQETVEETVWSVEVRRTGDEVVAELRSEEQGATGEIERDEVPDAVWSAFDLSPVGDEPILLRAETVPLQRDGGLARAIRDARAQATRERREILGIA